MTWLYCNECHSHFLEEDSGHRMAEEEDCIPRGTLIMCCPNCKSSEIEYVKTCKICEAPLTPDEEDFCEDCTDKMDRVIDNLICNIEGDWLDAKNTFLDYIERRWL